MKIATISLLLCLNAFPVLADGSARVGQSGWAGTWRPVRAIPNDLTEQHRIEALEAANENAKASEQQAREWEAYKANFLPEDPWREFQGKTNFVKKAGVEFFGRVRRVQKDGVVIDGGYGPIFTINPRARAVQTLFVTGMPFQVVDDQVIKKQIHMMAFEGGTLKLDGKTVRQLEWGNPCGPSPEALEQQAQARAAADKAKQDKAARIFKSRKDLADGGDATYQYMVGQSYLNGDGVDQDPAKAKEYFIKSAAQGNADAAKALEKMKALSSATP